MTQLIAYVNDEGGVSIVVPVDLSMSIEEVASRSVPEGKRYRVIDADKVPKDRTFRKAWQEDLSIDMAKAIEIQKDQLRELRRPLLQELDVLFLKHIEAGDITKASRVAARKQVLRDITNDPRLYQASCPEELKACVPDLALHAIEP